MAADGHRCNIAIGCRNLLPDEPIPIPFVDRPAGVFGRLGLGEAGEGASRCCVALDIICTHHRRAGLSSVPVRPDRKTIDLFSLYPQQQHPHGTRHTRRRAAGRIV